VLTLRLRAVRSGCRYFGKGALKRVTVIFMVLFGEFEIGIPGHTMPAQQYQTPAFIYQGLLIELVEEENTIGQFYDLLCLVGHIGCGNKPEEGVNNMTRDIRFDVIEPGIMDGR
jgi:hypothetical protein